MGTYNDVGDLLGVLVVDLLELEDGVVPVVSASAFIGVGVVGSAGVGLAWSGSGACR